MSYSTSFHDQHDLVGIVCVTGDTKEEILDKLKKAVKELEEVNGFLASASMDSITNLHTLGKIDNTGKRVNIIKVICEQTVPALTRDFDYSKRFVK